MSDIKMDVINYFINNKDEKYKDFNDKIINTKMKTIGVRTPIIKELAKEIYKNNISYKINNDYYEFVLLEGFILSFEKDTNILINKLDKFIDKIDNWAICDMVCSSSKALNKNKDITLKFINNNINSNNFWRVRFCFIILLHYFVEFDYLDIIFKYIEDDKNDFYYVMMAKAWLISECYVKYPSESMAYLKNTNLDSITYNKAISKICDSYRVLKDDKNILKSMKK